MELLNTDQLNEKIKVTDELCSTHQINLVQFKKPDGYTSPCGYMFDSFPERPKYMKRDKYYKHYQKFVNYTKKGDSFWLNGLSNLK